MPNLPPPKVGLIACSGEEFPEGTVTRLAVRRVLETLRPDATVTICLPLFLAGEAGERAFARAYPTITVDGCALRCAARATEKYSAAPAATLVVPELLAERGLPAPGNARRLDAAGEAAVAETAEVIAATVDRLLDRAPAIEPAPAVTLTAAPCSCGSNIPVGRLQVGDRTLELLALPALLASFHAQGAPADAATVAALLQQVRLYNAIATEDEPFLREALLAVYRQGVG